MSLFTPFPDAPWFSIDEDQYLVYLLKGYEIKLSTGERYVYFTLDGRYHREDGPAIIDIDGTVEYWQNGLRHRDDGPAVIWSNGFEEYWQNDKLHREDGPAIIRSDGSVDYWLNHVVYSKEKYYEALEDGNY